MRRDGELVERRHGERVLEEENIYGELTTPDILAEIKGIKGRGHLEAMEGYFTSLYWGAREIEPPIPPKTESNPVSLLAPRKEGQLLPEVGTVPTLRSNPTQFSIMANADRQKEYEFEVSTHNMLTSPRFTDAHFREQNPYFIATPFNMLIEYGEYISTYQQYTIGPDKQQHYSPRAAATVRMISGIRLTGVAQEINIDGKPIYEVYTFLASDLDFNEG